MKAVNLRCEFMHDPMGIDIKRPLLTWICEGGRKQTAYELTVSMNGIEVYCSGKQETDRMNHRLEISVRSRAKVEWKVRLWDERDEAGEWSGASFEYGLLSHVDWAADWINPEKVNLTEVNNRPASILRKTFTLDEVKSARLYATAHGMYAVDLNGERVGDAVLMPGTSAYHQRLEYQTLDVTAYLREGKNEIRFVLGDGWYRGKSGMNNTEGNLYGKDIALLAQLEMEGKVVVKTDTSWQATQSGPIMKNGLDFGEVVDARREPKDWHEVRIEEFGFGNLVCSNNVPVKEHESFEGKVITTPKGETVIDFGQNIAGYVEIRVNTKGGETIHMVHGETLDKDGNFTIDNFQHAGHDPKKLVPQEVVYTCKEGNNVYKPTFSMFGFQYVKVESDIPVENITFTAHAVYSDMEQTGFFECGNEDVNQLFRNTLWSMKGNFADIPTDCPTRERSGWTGDCGAFVRTGTYLMNCYPVLRKWLCEVRADQMPNGAVPGVAPLNEQPQGFKKMSDGSAGWGDAIGIVPSTLAKVYGCDDVLEENYEAFKHWMEFCEKRAAKTRLRNLTKFGKHRKYTVDKGFHWGEWLEPDVSSVTVLKDTIMKGAPEVPTAYLAFSAQLLSDAAAKLGKDEDAKKYADLAGKVREAYHDLQLKNGRIVSERQAQYVRPIALDIISEEEKVQAAQDLNDLVIKNGYHLNTGFLSTPFLTEVLSRYGYVDTAYKLLLQDTAPSWLYAVKKGANTIWETWTAKEEDGRVHDSLNHYSYGAIVGWLFKEVAGIKVENGEITIEPTPDKVLGHAHARYDSVYGRIESGWKYDPVMDKFTYTVVIPCNMSAKVKLPGYDELTLEAGEHTL